MALTVYMYEEKKEEDDLPVVKIVWTHRYKSVEEKTDYSNISP